MLPPDARFCHKCGKPQYEEDIQRIAAQEAAPPAPVQARIEPPLEARFGGISFRDGRAVTITLLAAVLAFVGVMLGAMLLPALAPVLFPLVLLVAGFLVPAAYRTPKQENLSTAAGARLGWMMGVWFFFAVVIIVTFVTIILATPEGADSLRQLKTNPQFSQMKIATPRDLLMNLVMSALPIFLLVTLLPGLGGMLGARFWSGRRS